MYARLLRFRLRPGALSAFGPLYDERIVPALGSTEGCLGVVLLAHVRQEEALISLTLWRERRHPEEYDGTGRFARLLNEADSLIADGEELDATPAGSRVPDDLAVEGYSAELLAPAELGEALVPGSFARSVTARVAPDRVEEFDRRYRSEVRSALVDFPGLFAVFLLHGAEKPGATVGLSFWHGEDAAARYDLSGRFDELAGDVHDTLSPVSRWRNAWVAAGLRPAAADLEVDLHRVRTARVF